MTATLAAVMVDAGKIDWETSIGDVWPKATDAHIHPKLRTVTLDELLSHQSGLPSDISGQAWLSFFKEKQSPVLERRRMLKLVLSKAPSQRQGTFSYSNLGYVIVAAMLETRARASFESLMKKHIFDPLGMRSADFRSMKSAKQIQPPLLWGHQAESGEPVDPRSVGAENPTVYASCGTIHLSIEDYAKYARWHLVGKPAPVLRSQSAFDHLHEPQVDHTIPGTKYACGWFCIDTGLGPALNHGGSNTNAFALIWVLPKSDLAAVVCTNTGQPQAFPACDEVISHLMVTHAAARNRKTNKGSQLRKADYAKKSPFAAVRWKESQPEVRIGEEWLKLVSLDELPASEIVAFSRRTYGNKWRQRFEEDLVELLTRMGHPPRDTVTLVVQSLTSSETRVREGVPMTEANRNAIKAAATR
jgi:CubicO group peptidase (beta-lactamase class C family)